MPHQRTCQSCDRYAKDIREVDRGKLGKTYLCADCRRHDPVTVKAPTAFQRGFAARSENMGYGSDGGDA